MPEINVMLFDLAHLFLLFQKENQAEKQDMSDYEENTRIYMAQIRLNLFSEYSDERQKAYI